MPSSATAIALAPSEPTAKATKPYPFCGEDVLEVAVKCKHCGERLDAGQAASTVISFSCPVCSRSMQGPSALANTTATCPECRKKFVVTPESHAAPKSEFVGSLPPLLVAILTRDWRRVATSIHLWLALPLFFLPWVNISCNDRVIGSQSGFQTCYGGSSIDPKLKKLAEEPAQKAPGGLRPNGAKDRAPASVLSLIYGAALLIGGVLGILCVFSVIARTPTWHNALAWSTGTHLLSLGFGALAFLFLALQMAVGFPVEHEFDRNMKKAIAKQRADKDVPDFAKGLGVEVAGAMVEFKYSAWLWISCVITFVSVPALVVELLILCFMRTQVTLADVEVPEGMT